MSSPKVIILSNLVEDDRRAHQLQLLMQFLIGGVEALPHEFQSIPLPVRMATPQRVVADRLGVSQPIVSGWKTGKKKLLPHNEFRLASYCKILIERLQAYLAGQLSLSDLWTIEESPYMQVLDLLPLLNLKERIDLLYRCLNQWAQEADCLSFIKQ